MLCIKIIQHQNYHNIKVGKRSCSWWLKQIILKKTSKIIFLIKPYLEIRCTLPKLNKIFVNFVQVSFEIAAFLWLSLWRKILWTNADQTSPFLQVKETTLLLFTDLMMVFKRIPKASKLILSSVQCPNICFILNIGTNCFGKLS